MGQTGRQKKDITANIRLCSPGFSFHSVLCQVSAVFGVQTKQSSGIGYSRIGEKYLLFISFRSISVDRNP